MRQRNQLIQHIRQPGIQVNQQRQYIIQVKVRIIQRRQLGIQLDQQRQPGIQVKAQTIQQQRLGIQQELLIQHIRQRERLHYQQQQHMRQLL